MPFSSCRHPVSTTAGFFASALVAAAAPDAPAVPAAGGFAGVVSVDARSDGPQAHANTAAPARAIRDERSNLIHDLQSGSDPDCRARHVPTANRRALRPLSPETYDRCDLYGLVPQGRLRAE